MRKAADTPELRRLALRLTTSGVAAADELEGCTEAELMALEQCHGRMPDSYRQILSLIGRRSGKLVDRDEFWIHIHQLDHINREAREAIALYAEDGIDVGVPDTAFFISARYGADTPHYLLTGEARDSVVWCFDNDDGEVKPSNASVWDWLEGFILDAERRLGRHIR